MANDTTGDLTLMTEKTYYKLSATLSNAKWQARQSWLLCWELRPGEPRAELATHWAQELQDLNDAHRELEQLYYAEYARMDRGELARIAEQRNERCDCDDCRNMRAALANISNQMKGSSS